MMYKSKKLMKKGSDPLPGPQYLLLTRHDLERKQISQITQEPFHA